MGRNPAPPLPLNLTHWAMRQGRRGVWPSRRVEHRAGLEIVDTPTFRYWPFTTCTQRERGVREYIVYRPFKTCTQTERGGQGVHIVYTRSGHTHTQVLTLHHLYTKRERGQGVHSVHKEWTHPHSGTALHHLCPLSRVL